MTKKFEFEFEDLTKYDINTLRDLYLKTKKQLKNTIVVGNNFKEQFNSIPHTIEQEIVYTSILLNKLKNLIKEKLPDETFTIQNYLKI
ncbi:MAG: hypothetical protein ACTSQY_00670 [Candidatus Odinarchaeia archaeon]